MTKAAHEAAGHRNSERRRKARGTGDKIDWSAGKRAEKM